MIDWGILRIKMFPVVDLKAQSMSFEISLQPDLKGSDVVRKANVQSM